MTRPEGENLPELIAYAEANGWRLVDDSVLPPSGWLGGPTGMPGWVLIFAKDDRAVGYEWHGKTTRHEAGWRLLRALRKWDAPDPPTGASATMPTNARVARGSRSSCQLTRTRALT